MLMWVPIRLVLSLLFFGSRKRFFVRFQILLCLIVYFLPMSLTCIFVQGLFHVFTFGCECLGETQVGDKDADCGCDDANTLLAERREDTREMQCYCFLVFIY